jgi:dTMP kinase
MKGIFITFEGSEGCGKSTQSRILYRFLKARGYDAVYLREPGGTKISEKIRKILLDHKNEGMTAVSELLLYMASRAQIVEEVIRPALKQNKIVICDRFLDSTIAYQGYGLGMDIKLINYVGDFVTSGIKPDMTIFLDLPVAKGLNGRSRVKDRIERRNFAYHQRVRQGYLKIADFEPKRVKIIKVDKDKAVTQGKIRKSVLEKCHLKI